jgi:phospholipid/cholesterol/gamma-HCH transport system substrate-binding protein
MNNERIMQFRVGVMILATILIAAILVLLSREGSRPLLSGTYPIQIKFNKAPNVTRGTPVRKAGIRIGQVREVRLAERDSGVIVTADIEKDRHLYSDEQCEVTNSFPMNDAALEIVKMGDAKDAPELQYGANMPALESTQDMTSTLADMQGKASAALDAMTRAGQDVHELLGDRKFQADIKQTVEKMPVAVDRVEKTFASLQHGIHNIDGLTEKLGKSMDKLSALSDQMLQFSQDLNNPNGKFQRVGENMLAFSEKLKNPTNSLGALLDDKGELYQNVNGVAKNLNELTGVMVQLSKQLDDPQNSLGSLVRDKELYPRVVHTMKNVEELTRELKPIVNNVAIFSDKIARHPSSLGVRGALEKDTGLKDSPADSGDESDVPQARRWPIGGSGQWNFGQ